MATTVNGFLLGTARALLFTPVWPAPVRVLRPQKLLVLENFGKHSFTGEVDVITTPAPARVVRLHDRASGRVVRETATDAAGLYSFADVTNLRDYYIVALDTQPGGYDDVIAGPRVPA